MRARKQLDVMAAVLALPKGPVRDEMWRLAGRAMDNLGYAQLESQVHHNTALQEEYAQAVSLSPTGAPPYARDRVRLSSLITRQLMAENAIRERAFELARAEYYGLHGVDPLATLPPWLRGEPGADQPPAPEHAPQAAPEHAVHIPWADPSPNTPPAGAAREGHEPRATARGHAATLPREAAGAERAPEVNAGPQDAADDAEVASMGYVKELAKRLRNEGLSHEDGLRLRLEAKQRKLTRGQVGARAIELLTASHRAKSKQPQSAKA